MISSLIYAFFKDQPFWHVKPEVVRQESHLQASLESTRQSMTLLQNPNQLLPLKKGTKIGVMGPHALSKQQLTGNYVGQFCPHQYLYLQLPFALSQQLCVTLFSEIGVSHFELFLA